MQMSIDYNNQLIELFQQLKKKHSTVSFFSDTIHKKKHGQISKNYGDGEGQSSHRN